MDNNVLANDKLYAVPKKSSQLEQIKQTSKPISEEIVVTLCLSSCEECNGRYEDSTGRFKIQCRCCCHTKFKQKFAALEEQRIEEDRELRNVLRKPNI